MKFFETLQGWLFAGKWWWLFLNTSAMVRCSDCCVRLANRYHQESVTCTVTTMKIGMKRSSFRPTVEWCCIRLLVQYSTVQYSTVQYSTVPETDVLTVLCMCIRHSPSPGIIRHFKCSKICRKSPFCRKTFCRKTFGLYDKIILFYDKNILS